MEMNCRNDHFMKKSIFSIWDRDTIKSIPVEILFLSMLTYISETFKLFEESISTHMADKRSERELFQITKDAYEDFIEYYDQGIVSEDIYREVYEFSKEYLGLNEQYRILIERLNLFGSYEIQEVNTLLTKRLMLLTVVVLAVAIVEFILSFIK